MGDRGGSRAAKGRRTSRITFSVTDEEKAWLLADADKAGLSLAHYLRRDLLRLYRLEQLAKEAERRAQEARRAHEEARRSYEDSRARRGQHGRRGTDACGGKFVTAAAAEAWLRNFTNARPGESIPVMLRRACHRAHPDKGGRAEDWACVDQVRRMLLAHR